MKNSLPVRIVERVGNRRAHVENAIDWQRAALEARLQCATRDVLHDEKVESVLHVEIENRRDTWM